MPDFPSTAVDHRLLQALRATLQAVPGAATNSNADAETVAIAYSGGLDSSVLLAVAARLGLKLVALHVHHGLSPQADAWLAHCQARAAALGVAFQAEHVTLEDTADNGVEQAARVARYAALGRMCRQHGVRLLLTAHHLDDQAETVLLQMLRGSGLAGMSGMDNCAYAPSLVGDAQTVIVRPFLGLARAQLEAWATQEQLVHVDDESNADPRYTRNHLRHHVMPSLGQAFPGYQQRLARAAGHVQGAQELLREVAEQDLLHCQRDDHLLMPALRALSEQRFFNLMRHWFALRGMRMPSTAWMQEMREQLMSAGVEAQLCVSHPDGELHRYRERVFLAPRRAVPEEETSQALRWQGEAELPLAAWHGTLHFDVIAAGDEGVGIDAGWLRGQALLACGRSGGERVKLAANRPARSLKQQYQAADVPAWERPFLPLLWAGDTLLFAAGVGMDCTQLVSTGERVALRWQAR